ncbi:hypothetical protein LJC20_02380 [Eubacteriales bacterium OttesenSCG-928-M02]|nr:hypothetical protein [Eubacteriales bacterium OttesenSCG-928-M02]
MWIIILVLIAVLVVAISILLMGTKVKVNNNGIKTGLRTYTNEDILQHRFAVNVLHKSPAEYAAEHNSRLPWTGAPPSHKRKWSVELVVFDSNDQYIRTHDFQKPNEHAAEKLATELKSRLASQLILATDNDGERTEKWLG